MGSYMLWRWDGSCRLCRILPRDGPDPWVLWEGGPLEHGTLGSSTGAQTSSKW